MKQTTEDTLASKAMLELQHEEPCTFGLSFFSSARAAKLRSRVKEAMVSSLLTGNKPITQDWEQRAMVPYYPLVPDLSATVIEMTDHLPKVGNFTGLQGHND